MSHQYTLIVYTSPAEGREDDYNAWYDDVHLAEYSALPGVISGRRFKVEGNGPAAYAAVYELSAHPDQVTAAMNAGIKDGTVHMSDAIDPKSLSTVTLLPRLVSLRRDHHHRAVRVMHDLGADRAEQQPVEPAGPA
jgi:hypothetical protein